MVNLMLKYVQCTYSAFCCIRQVHVTTLRRYFGANVNMLAATFPLHRREAQPPDEHF